MYVGAVPEQSGNRLPSILHTSALARGRCR
jgi:hypothetical protein